MPRKDEIDPEIKNTIQHLQKRLEKLEQKTVKNREKLAKIQKKP